VIVVAANGTGGMSANPINAGNRIDSVFDKVSQKQAGIERLANGVEGKPIGMNVGKDEDFHGLVRFHWQFGPVSRSV
jgi:hypothetical protein